MESSKQRIMKESTLSDFQGGNVYSAKGLSPTLRAAMSHQTPIPKIIVEGNIYPKSKHEAGNIYNPQGLSPTLKVNGPRPNSNNIAPKIIVGSASDSQRLTSTPSKPTSHTSQATKTMETQRKLFWNSSQTLTSSLQDFRARRSVSQEKDWALKIQEELSFLKSQGCLKPSSHATFSLKTLKAYYLTMRGERLPLSLPRLMSWGIIVSGKLLTASILESRRTGKECSLSGILEGKEKVDSKYFLSDKMTKRLLEKSLLGGWSKLHTHSKREITPTGGETL